MPAIENVNRRGATYWWRRRVRFVGRLERPITIVTTVSLLTKDQSVARRRAVAMTSRSEVVRMSLYERIEQEGLTSEQVNQLFREEMVRYRNMLAHQLAVIEKDACKVGLRRRIEAGDPTFRAMSEAWSAAIRDGFARITI